MKTTKKTAVKTKGFLFDQPIQRISQKRLIGMLEQVVGSEIVTFHTNTVVKLNVKSRVDNAILCPFVISETKKAGINKCAKVNGLINVNYTSCVRKQLEREAIAKKEVEAKGEKFKAKNPAWGTPVNGSKILISHINKAGEFGLYLQFNPRNCYETRYIDKDGTKIDKAELVDFMQIKKSYSRQGTDKEIIWRKYKVESIVAVKIKKVLYVVV